MVDKKYTSHYNIRSQTLIEANKIPGVKLWANPVGLGFMGTVVEDYQEGTNHFVKIKNPRRMKFGLAPGSSDTIGFKTERIGNVIVPRFCGFEIKAGKDRARPKQLNFLNIVQEHGGIAGMVRSSDDFERLISSPLLINRDI